MSLSDNLLENISDTELTQPGFESLSSTLIDENLLQTTAFSTPVLTPSAGLPNSTGLSNTTAETGTSDDEENEPNNTISGAINTGFSSSNPASFTFASKIGGILSSNLRQDVNFFQFQLDVGDQVTIDIDASELGSSLDSVLRVFDASGNELAMNDDNPAPGESFSSDSFLSFSASSSDTYYVGVSGHPNFNYDPLSSSSGVTSTGEYSLEIALAPLTEFIGTSDDDFLVGTPGRDLILGLEGNDTILGLAGNDQIFGGDGDDSIAAGDGNDVVEGGRGADRIYGGSGDDTIAGNSGLDIILAGDGNDLVSGGPHKDRIFGEAGDDRIYGDGDNDIIDAGAGFDTVYGGAGKDQIFGGSEDDSLFGGSSDDELHGDDGADSLNGGEGNDLLMGGAEDDTLTGGLGADLLEGGSGFDFLDGGDGDDVLIGVDRFSTQSGGFGAYEVDTLTGGLGSDTFVLGDAERVYYDEGNPILGGDFDYARITDFDSSQDFIRLHGAADFYSLDFFTLRSGSVDAALIYDAGDLARGEVIAVLQGVSTNLSITNPTFTFV